MPEVAEQKQPEAVASEAPIEANPFDESSWTSQQPKPVVQENQPNQEVKQEDPKPNQAAAEEVIDANEYLRQQLGYESWDLAKTELQQLREFKEKGTTQAEIKFANEQSQKLFDAWKEGKTDEVYSYLHQQRQLDRLEKLEINNVDEAAEIIKANLQYKYKDLTPKQIDRLYNKEYSMPVQPRQEMEEADEDFKIRMDEWKLKVQEKEEDILINAKIARPELVKYKSELVLPDIPNTNKQPAQPEVDPKVQEAFELGRNMYLNALEKDYNNFSGFESKVKSELGEFAVAFKTPDEEKVVYANKLKEFDINQFIDNRWWPGGKPNVQQMMHDLYLLENTEKVFQGLSNNAASNAIDNYLKVKSNVKVDGSASQTNGFQLTAKEAQLKQEEALWD